MRTEKPSRLQVHLSSEEFRELILDTEKPESGYVAGLELYQHVEIAVGAKVRAERGTEHRKATDVVTVAVFRQALKVDVEW
jgi:hypothetical protein